MRKKIQKRNARKVIDVELIEHIGDMHDLILEVSDRITYLDNIGKLTHM